MKNIDALAQACAPAEPINPAPTQPQLTDDMIQRVAERVVQILSQPAADPAPKQPEPAPDLPDPEPMTGGETGDEHSEPIEMG